MELPDWAEGLDAIDAEERDSSYALGEGKEGVRLDGYARDLDALMHGAVTSYNATVSDDEEVAYARKGVDREVVVPTRIYDRLADLPDTAFLTFEGESEAREYGVVTPTDEPSQAFTSVSDDIVERYFSFDEMPEGLESRILTAVDGHMMQGRMLYVDRGEDRGDGRGETDLALAAGGHEEGVTMLYRQQS